MRVVWQGMVGAPGISTFYFTETQPHPVPAIRSFFDTIKAFLPTAVTLNFENQGDMIEEGTGNIGGEWNAPAVANVVGTGTGGYAGPVGGIIRWTTDGIADGRRVRGRTFLVPMAQSALTGSGIISASNVTALTTAASNMVSQGNGTLCIWHRPKGGTGGSRHVILNGAAQPLTAVLRSRRD